MNIQKQRNNPQSNNNIQKVSLPCSLCSRNVSQPKMCPQCSEIFCRICLTKFHDEHRCCPSCHGKYELTKFIDCRCFLGYIVNSIKKLKSQKKQIILNDIQISYEQKCQQHNIPMKYYCQNCAKAICSDCGMISNQHRGHRFLHLNQIYSKVKEKLSRQLDKLNEKIFEYQQHSLHVKAKMHKLDQGYAIMKKYVEEYYMILVDKFQEQISNKSSDIKEIQQKNNKQIDFYESYRDNICDDIEKKTKVQLIVEADKLQSSFTIVVEQPQMIKVEDSFETIKELIPDYNHFDYTLHNFSLSTGGIVYSDPFCLHGIEWRLKIYPKGNGVAKGKYLSVFVQMSKADSNQKKYQYKIQLINKDPTSSQNSQNIRRQYCSAFDIGECWGYNQFILLEELENGFLQDDTLQFNMGIRNPNYKLLADDQLGYIQTLQAQVRLKELERENEVEKNIIDGGGASAIAAANSSRRKDDNNNNKQGMFKKGNGSKLPKSSSNNNNNNNNNTRVNPSQNQNQNQSSARGFIKQQDQFSSSRRHYNNRNHQNGRESQYQHQHQHERQKQEFVPQLNFSNFQDGEENYITEQYGHSNENSYADSVQKQEKMSRVEKMERQLEQDFLNWEKVYETSKREDYLECGESVKAQKQEERENSNINNSQSNSSSNRKSSYMMQEGRQLKYQDTQFLNNETKSKSSPTKNEKINRKIEEQQQFLDISDIEEKSQQKRNQTQAQNSSKDEKKFTTKKKQLQKKPVMKKVQDGFRREDQKQRERQMQISSILEQSKKLKGIDYQKDMMSSSNKIQSNNSSNFMMKMERSGGSGLKGKEKQKQKSTTTNTEQQSYPNLSNSSNNNSSSNNVKNNTSQYSPGNVRTIKFTKNNSSIKKEQK